VTSKDQQERIKDEILSTYQPYNIVRLGIKNSQIGWNAMEVFREMKEKGASPHVLLKYIAAPSDPSLTEKAREEVYQDWLQVSHEKDQERVKGIVVRSSVVALTASSLVFLIPYMITQGVALSGLQSVAASSLALPALSEPIQLVWKNVMGEGLMAPMLAGIGAWLFLRKSLQVPNLKIKLVEEQGRYLEVESELKNRMKNRCLGMLRRIPPEDFHLLGHLDALDLRSFLMADTKVRSQILKQNPPSWMAMLRTMLCEHQSLKSWPRLGLEVFKGSLPLKVFNWNSWSVEKKLRQWDPNSDGLLADKKIHRAQLDKLGKIMKDQEKINAHNKIQRLQSEKENAEKSAPRSPKMGGV